jgi:hypothetical protein
MSHFTLQPPIDRCDFITRYGQKNCIIKKLFNLQIDLVMHEFNKNPTIIICPMIFGHY